MRAATIAREVARAGAACPVCGAEPGEPCRGSRRPRVANHAGRAELAVRAAHVARETCGRCQGVGWVETPEGAVRCEHGPP